MSARSVECKCDPHFTCGYCLRNAKPPIYTPSSPAQRMSSPAAESAAATPKERLDALDEAEADAETGSNGGRG